MNDSPSKPRSPFRLDPYLLLTVAISAVAAVPLLGPYFVGSHDGVLAVYRFFEFDRSIQDGILLPRWAPDLFFGYGYPFFNFYAPLSYYVAEVFHHLGAGFVGSISGAFALGFVLSGLFMYLLVRDLAGRWAGVLAGLAYVFAPYHLVNAHLRGDLAEFFAFVWFPAILWAAGRLIARRNLGYLALTAVLYAALLLTHNIMALAFSPLLAAYMIFLLLRERKAPELARRAAFGLLAVALAFGLSAFFWVPALQQIGEIQIGRLANDPSFYFRSSLMQISGYVSDAILQDYGPRSAGGDYGYPVELGLLQVMMAVAAVRLMAWRWRRGERAGVAPFGFLAVAALAYYAVMFPWSLFLWEKLPLMSYLQSPWRLLPFLILFTSVLIGYLGGWAARLRPAWAGATLLLLALLVTVPNVVNLQPRYVDLQESDVTVNGTIRFEMMSQDLGMTAAGEYLPKGVRSKLTGSPLALDAVSQSQPPTPFDPGFLAKGAQAEVLETRTTLARFRVQSPEGTAFLFNQTYFPGWEAYTDGQPATIRGIGSANLMALDVPGGQHDLEFRFQDTRSRILGEAVSLASLVGVIAILALTVRRRSQSHHGDVQGETVPATRHNRAQPDTTGHHHPRPAANRLALAGLVAVLATSAAFLAPRLNPPSSSVASFPVNATWSSGPTLLGYDLSSTTLIPGQSLDLTLHWGERPQGQDTRVEIKGHTGQVWAQSLAKSDSAGDATNTKQVTRLNLPLNVPPGMYRITLDVLDSGKPLPLRQENLARPIFPEKSLLLGPVLVTRGRAGAQVQIPAAAVRHEVDLEKKVALLGYSLDWKDRSLDLTTYWRPLSIFREDYAVFAHLVDLSDQALTKNDLQPWASPYPSTLWQPGDLVSVPFHFDLTAGFTPQDHRINVGMYTPDNFQRLSVLDPAGNPITNTIYLSLTP